MSNYIDEKKLQDLLKNGKGIPFISPELIRVLGIDEMYKKQGALEELKRIEEAWHHIGSKGVCNYIEKRIRHYWQSKIGVCKCGCKTRVYISGRAMFLNALIEMLNDLGYSVSNAKKGMI